MVMPLLIPPSWYDFSSAGGRGRPRRWRRAFFVSIVLVLDGDPMAQGQTIPQPADPKERAPARAAQPSAPSAADVSLQDIEQHLGPFRIGGQDFTVVLHLK